MKKLDETLLKVEGELLKKAQEQEKMKPYLDKQLYKVQSVDNKIAWHEKKIQELEVEKQNELQAMENLLDMAQKHTHSLKNGYTVKPDDKRKITIKDNLKFLSWLKKNKTPMEVMTFFKDALKIANVKKFVNEEINDQRTQGIIEPEIDGIEHGEITYRRLTTKTVKPKTSR